MDDHVTPPSAPDPGGGRRILPYGPRALLVELAPAESVHGLLAAATAARSHGEFDADAELVVGARTLLIDGVADPAAVGAAALVWEPIVADPTLELTVEVPTVFDGDDLGDVARAWDMTVAEAVATHTGFVHRVAFLGFAPGFAYVEGLPPALAVARRATPRAAVPAGAVAVAARYSAVYPAASPGGWQLIGRTALTVWDVDAEPPALLMPGTAVRFVAVDATDAVDAGTVGGRT